MRTIIKKVLLKIKKKIILDRYSTLNYGVINKSINSKYPCRIIESKCNFEIVNEGCKISEARCYGDITLGRFVTITGPGTVVKSLKEKIYIGSFSSIGQNVCIVDFNHLFERVTSSFIHHLIFEEDFRTDLIGKGPVIIEEDVWVGSNTVILPGVKIGRGSIIGAGSVVTKDIPRYSVAYGNPAKVRIKRFDDEKIEYLENLKWWEWSIDEIVKNKNLFSMNLKDYNVDELFNLVVKFKNENR
ncbi:CatB-related O-acetyltransferase [Flavobacterium sp. CLA17]|uniref:CatB-related O-acetyltransferase n=1 Tax=Flavobacterium sp. CLA17 TaxID=2724135 RepID=UPI0014931048|nr:CatB-related O-acetyltransferase [Flavobacterium sp. CLA17]